MRRTLNLGTRVSLASSLFNRGLLDSGMNCRSPSMRGLERTTLCHTVIERTLDREAAHPVRNTYNRLIGVMVGALSRKPLPE